jgi:hypothetical protein
MAGATGDDTKGMRDEARLYDRLLDGIADEEAVDPSHRALVYVLQLARAPAQSDELVADDVALSAFVRAAARRSCRGIARAIRASIHNTSPTAPNNRTTSCANPPKSGPTQ